MSVLHVVMLAVVQGVTEFLPISSSAHVIIVSETFLSGHPAGFDILLHAATFMAVVLYFRKDISRLVQGLFSGTKNADKSLAYALLVATLPIMVAGVFVYEVFESLRMVSVAAVALIVSGSLLIIADYGIHHRWLKIDMPLWRKGLSVGLLQILAILPGVSRSGITIAGGRLFGFSRKEASRFSFLLAIPVIAGALVLLLLKTPLTADSFAGVDFGVVFVGMVVGFGSAYAVIHLFLKLIDRVGFMPFFMYQVLLGLVLLFTGI